MARKAWYEMKDYALSQKHGIEGFTLMLERQEIRGQEQWRGCFEYGQKQLKVIGTLEA